MTKNLLFAIKRQHFLAILRKDTLIYTTVSAKLMNNSIFLPAFSKFTQGIFSRRFLSSNSLNCPYLRTTAAFSAFFLCTRLTGCISHSAGRHSPFGRECSNRTILHRLMQKRPADFSAGLRHMLIPCSENIHCGRSVCYNRHTDRHNILVHSRLYRASLHRCSRCNCHENIPLES